MNLTTELVELLHSPAAQQHLREHQGSDPKEYALKGKSPSGLPPAALAEQLACRKRAAAKLPFLVSTPFVYEREALEQCSGELAARYKSSLFMGAVCIDLSGGQGIDSLFFARSFERVHYCEIDPVRAGLFSANCRALGVTNITVHTGDAAEILKSITEPHIDLIYADPCRRSGDKRVHDLAAGSPNPVDNWKEWCSRARYVMVKGSPLFDAQQGLVLLDGAQVARYVSVQGECRELLVIRDAAAAPLAPAQVSAAVLRPDRPPIVISRCLSQTEAPPTANLAAGEYLFDPDPAIRAARLEPALASQYGLSVVGPHCSYLSGDSPLENLPARALKIIAVLTYSRSTVKDYLRQRGITAATVQARANPTGAARYREILGLAESAKVYLVLAQKPNGKQLCIHAEAL